MLTLKVCVDWQRGLFPGSASIVFGGREEGMPVGVSM